MVIIIIFVIIIIIVIRFADAVESGAVQPLCGGYAHEVVGADQDESKMDINQMLSAMSQQQAKDRMNRNRKGT